MADDDTQSPALDEAIEEALEPAPPDETPRQRERRFGRLGRVLAIFAVVMALAFAIVEMIGRGRFD